MVTCAPRLSVIVATYNRRPRLAEVLRALERQTMPRGSYEVIVVDDESKDDTAEWFHTQVFATPCRLLRQTNQGASAARNHGIDMARGEILVFLDDDFVPDPDLLAEHLKIHDSDNRVAVIGPTPSISRSREPWIAWQQATMARTCAAMALGEREPGFREFWSGNCSVARKHVLAVGGFDASLRSYEDVELGYRLMRHGLRFRFCPSATGLHYSAHSFAEWCATTRDYAPFSIRLFRQLGDDTMYGLLSCDWADRHPMTRWLVRRTVGRRGRTTAAMGLLKAGVLLGSLAPMSTFSRGVCSAMANIFYWDGVAQELGCGRSLWTKLEARATAPTPQALPAPPMPTIR